MSDRLEKKLWEFGECRHALYEGDRMVFDSMRDMGLSAEDAARIEERLNAYDALIAEVERLRRGVTALAMREEALGSEKVAGAMLLFRDGQIGEVAFEVGPAEQRERPNHITATRRGDPG